MSVPTIIRTLAAAFSIAVCMPAFADEFEPAERLAYRSSAEAGVLFPQWTDMHSFPGSGGSSKLTLNPGFRVGLGSGYEFTPYFALDWEIAILAATVDKASRLQAMDATLTQVPFLVNAIFQYENQTGFTPFAGVGVGVSSSAIDVDEARTSTARVEGSDYEFVFAWQLTGGVKYAFGKRLGAGVVYKYLWTADAKWDLDVEAAPSASESGKLEIDGIHSHAVMAYLSYRF